MPWNDTDTDLLDDVLDVDVPPSFWAIAVFIVLIIVIVAVLYIK